MSDIQDRLDRLRRAGRLRRRTRPQSPATVPVSQPSEQALSARAETTAENLLDLPGMQEVEGERGRYLLRTLHYDLSHQQGGAQLRELLDVPAGSPAMAGNDPALAGLDFRQAAFIDTETSGLAGGAGTIVFLTGVGVYEDDQYVVRQYFARNPAEEVAYLDDLSQFLREKQGYISFNGKSFDLPLLRSRFILASIDPPDSQSPHFDLLHPARRLWRERLGACNFGNLEIQILGHNRSGADVPSWMIPDLWFRFAAGENNVADMERVLYHNQEDIVSMAPLAFVLCGIFGGILNPHPHDLVPLARSHAKRGDHALAEAAYQRALDAPLTQRQRDEAMAGLAAALKRQDRRPEAAIWWYALAEDSPADSVDPHIELAKFHEWETGNFAEARRWTLAARESVGNWPVGYQKREMLAELDHRLERLNRKLEMKG